MKSFIYSLFVCLLLSTTLGSMLAQSIGEDYVEQEIESRSFDQANWESLSESLDYSGKPPKPKKEREEPTSTPDTEEPFDFGDMSFLSPILKVVLFIVVIGLLGWLIYAFIQRNELSFAPPTEGDASEEEDLSNIERLEEELDKRNVDPYLLKAEQEDNYHLAVRLHYLALLKQLHEQQLIQWKKDRTNRAYLNQLRSQDHYPAFRQLTLTFERVWYGNYHPPKEEYKTIKEQFENYRHRLLNAVPV